MAWHHDGAVVQGTEYAYIIYKENHQPQKKYRGSQGSCHIHYNKVRERERKKQLLECK